MIQAHRKVRFFSSEGFKVSGSRASIRLNVLRSIAILVLLAAGFFLLRPVIGLALGAIFLAFLVNPLVDLIERKGASRPAAALTTYLFLGLVFAIALAVLIPIISTELRQAGVAVPRLVRDVQQHFITFERKFERFRLPFRIREALYNGLQRAQSRIEAWITRLAVGIPGLFSRILTFFLVPILAFYISRDFPRWARSLLKAVPLATRAEVVRIGTDVNRALSGYIRGQLTVGAVVGILITAGLLALNVEFAILIGLIAAVFNVVPYFGPILGATPALFLALRVSPWTPLYVIALFVAVNQVDSTLISPRIVGRHVGLPPFVIILAILAGGRLFGVVGLLAAVPTVAMIKIIVPYLWRRAGGDDTALRPSRPDITVAVEEHGRLWLVLTPAGWGLPNTSVLAGETPEQAGVRAVREYLGFAAAIDSCHPAEVSAKGPRSFHARAHPVGKPTEPRAAARLYAPAEAALLMQDAFRGELCLPETRKDIPVQPE